MGKIFSDYSLIDLSTLTGRKQFVGALAAYARVPETIQSKLIQAGITNLTVTDDFPAEVKELIERYHLGLEAIDTGWAQFFDVRDFSQVRAPGFRMREVSSGLTFRKRAEGGRVQIYALTGEEQYVSFDTYGGGLEFDQAWFDDQEWWLIEDTAVEFISAWYRDKATVMYKLIGALAAGYDVAYDATGANALEKDVITLNTAIAALLTALQALGHAVTPATPVKVLSPIQLMPRLNRALASGYTIPGLATALIKVEYNVTPVYSLNVFNAGAACTDKWYVGVPGLKNKVGEKMPLTVYTDFKLESFATETVGWGRYAAYLSSPQWRRLATA